MHKSTIIFCGLAIAFATLTGVVVAQLIRDRATLDEPRVEGALVQVGLPDLKPKAEGKHF